VAEGALHFNKKVLLIYNNSPFGSNLLPGALPQGPSLAGFSERAARCGFVGQKHRLLLVSGIAIYYGAKPALFVHG
jgi:hypothetical protein